MKNIEPQKDERPIMVVVGIMTLYIAVMGFVLYLFCLHRINLSTSLVLWFVITILNIPRFLIIKKLFKVDDVKIIDDFIMINNEGVNLKEIVDYRVKSCKPQVIFFLNNRMIIYQGAEFILRTNSQDFKFFVVGSEKISLLREFLNEIL